MSNRVPEVGIRRFPDGKSMVSLTKTSKYGDQTVITLTEYETAALINELTIKLDMIRASRELSAAQTPVPADPATWSGYANPR